MRGLSYYLYGKTPWGLKTHSTCTLRSNCVALAIRCVAVESITNIIERGVERPFKVYLINKFQDVSLPSVYSKEVDCSTSDKELRGTGKVCIFDTRIPPALDRASRVASLRPAHLQFSLQKRRDRTCPLCRVRRPNPSIRTTTSQWSAKCEQNRSHSTGDEEEQPVLLTSYNRE